MIVKQKVEMLEAFTGFETKNKYTVKNSMGQDVYKAKEDTDCCTRNICGPQRPFGEPSKCTFQSIYYAADFPKLC